MLLSRSILILLLSLFCRHDFATRSSAVVNAEDGVDVDKTREMEPEADLERKPLPCFEADHRFAPTIPMDIWDEKKKMMFIHTPAEYIVVRDGGKRCKTHAECLTALTNALRKTVDSECRALDNFYIGGDGEVYEGRGWGSAPYWHLNGMRTRAVTVKFLGTHDTEGPSERAMKAFWRMAKSGVWQNRLSPDYNILSMGQVYNDSKLVGQALEKVFLESSVGLMEANMMDSWEMVPDKTLPLVTREEWEAKKPTKPMINMGLRIKYVMINEGGERCFTHEECIALIKAEQEKDMQLYGDLVDNFYVGDDGYVYEGRGFNFKPLWDTDIDLEKKKSYKDESITVRIFGNFQSNLPSEKAIGALKLLVNAGMSLGRISESFKIFSLRSIYNDTRFLGERLFQTVRKWKPWDCDLEDLNGKKTAEGDGFIGMVKRATWGAKEPAKELEKLKHPVDHIFIEEHSENEPCLHSKKCSKVMKKVQEVALEEYGDVKDNFYVSDDGNIYEGRGWDLEPQFQPKYFNKSLITVNFLGDHQLGGPSLTALAAFDNLISIGVNLGKIAPNYHFYSSRDVYDDVELLGDGLKKHFAEKEQWYKTLEAMTEDDRLESGLLPIVPHEVWSEVTVNVTHDRYSKPVHYVVIGNIGERCYTGKECASNLREMQRSVMAKKVMSDNFYIGDDGMAYEGSGWSFAHSFNKGGYKSEGYHVTFLGQYGGGSKPSRLSILAFNRLMENGAKSHKLAPDYKIVSMHQFMKSGTESGDNLYAAVKTWDRYSSDFIQESGAVSTPSNANVSLWRQRGRLILADEWNQSKRRVQTHMELQHPLKYVVIRDGGKDCDTYETCIARINKEHKVQYDGVLESFYIGNDGNVYEGRGWDWDMNWYFTGWLQSITVQFFGIYKNDLPSERAIEALNSIIINDGIESGKLSPDYHIVPLPVSTGRTLGRKLKEEVMTWKCALENITEPSV